MFCGFTPQAKPRCVARHLCSSCRGRSARARPTSRARARVRPGLTPQLQACTPTPTAAAAPRPTASVADLRRRGARCFPETEAVGMCVNTGLDRTHWKMRSVDHSHSRHGNVLSPLNNVCGWNRVPHRYGSGLPLRTLDHPFSGAPSITLTPTEPKPSPFNPNPKLHLNPLQMAPSSLSDLAFFCRSTVESHVN